ncbi:hypothetical protein JHK82_049912 [Glycine max]|nr:hypothetical protein JHK86_049789 [Glycine max]KAG5091134.1 hypothetical protein JHK82_049912 [Glycine max]
MKLWSTNEVRAKSKFWYFLRKLKKEKKSNDQVLAINQDTIKMAFCNKVGNVSRQSVAHSTQAPVSSMLNYIRCMSSSKLFNGGLSYGVDDQSLKNAFSGFGDVVDGAEEYFLRAIMVDPNDGEILMQYAKLVWENHHDKDRAMVYFERVVQPTPQDRYHVRRSWLKPMKNLIVVFEELVPKASTSSTVDDIKQVCLKGPMSTRYIYLDDWMRFMREDEAADIPSLSAEAVKEHPDVSYNVTAPLGLHELFVAQVENIDSSTTSICVYGFYCFGKVLLELVTKIVDPSMVVDKDFLEEIWATSIVAKSCLKVVTSEFFRCNSYSSTL